MKNKAILLALFFGLLPQWLGAAGEGSPNVSLLLEMNKYPNAGYNDCWGYTAPDGREYALLGVATGTSIVDISDTENPDEVSFIRSDASLWKDIKTYQHYAYVSTEASPTIQIIDLSKLPVSASVAATYRGLETTPHNIFVDDEMAILYVAEDFNINRSVVALSLLDPLNLVELSRFGPDSHDMFAQDSILYVAEGSKPSIGIFDMRNPESPNLLIRHTIPAAGYVHNVWVSEDNSYMITTEETVGKTVKLWDIRDLENIERVDEYLGGNGLAHNAFIKNGYAYISHYSEGLRIVDLSDPTNINEVGYYDTQLGGSIGDGAWGTYPFFESGKIVISDIRTGLYVIEFDATTVDVADDALFPEEFELRQNYPNPFNPETMIPFQLPKSTEIQLVVYNASGQVVRSLFHGVKSAGTHQILWDGKDDSGRTVSSGVYFYRLTGVNLDFGRKMLFLR